MIKTHTKSFKNFGYREEKNAIFLPKDEGEKCWVRMGKKHILHFGSELITENKPTWILHLGVEETQCLRRSWKYVNTMEWRWQYIKHWFHRVQHSSRSWQNKKTLSVRFLQTWLNTSIYITQRFYFIFCLKRGVCHPMASKTLSGKEVNRANCATGT